MGEVGNICPVCGTEYPPSVIICTKCGVDIRTGEKLPEAFLKAEPFNWSKVGAIIKNLIYLAVLAAIAYYGWKWYKERESGAGPEQATPAAAPAPAPAAAPQPAAPRSVPTRAATVSTIDELAAALVAAASPTESAAAAGQLTVLFKKDFSLASRVMQETDPMLRIALSRALGNLGDVQAAALLFTLMADDDPRVADVAASEVQRLRRDVLAVEATKALGSPKSEVRRGAVDILCRLRAKDQAAEVAKLLDDTDLAVVARAVNFFRDIAADSATYTKLLRMAASTPDPVVAGILSEVIYFRTDKDTETSLAAEIERLPRERFFMVAPAAGKVRESKAGKALLERINVGLTGMTDEQRRKILDATYNASPEGLRSMLMELFLVFPRPGGYGDIAVTWLKSPNSDATMVVATALWAWRGEQAPFALASSLGEDKPLTAICVAIALSRQEKGAVLSLADKVLQSGNSQEKALAAAAAYLAGRKEAIDICRDAVKAGNVNDTIASFLRVLLAEAGDEEAIQACRAASDRERSGSLALLFAEAALVLADKGGSPAKLAEEAAKVKPASADILAFYFLWRAASAGRDDALAPLMSLYTRDSHYTGIFMGALLGAEKPAGLPKAAAQAAGSLSPRMIPGLAIALRPYGEEATKALLEVMSRGTQADRKGAMYVLAELGASDKATRESLADFVKANKDDQKFFLESAGALRRVAGKDVGIDWHEWYKVLAPEKYDINDEPLRQVTIASRMKIMLPSNWWEERGKYVTDRLPGEPGIRVSVQTDNSPPEKRRYPNSAAMLAAATQRYTIDIMTRQKVAGVTVDAPKVLRRPPVDIVYTVVTEPEGGKARLLAASVVNTNQDGLYIEVEADAAVKHFPRYRPLYQKVIESIEVTLSRW